MRVRQGYIVLSALLFILTSCADSDHLAPVGELTFIPWSKKDKEYTVRSGDTVYAIAFRYDKDYRDLMALNHLTEQSTLTKGMKIKLSGTQYAVNMANNHRHQRQKMVVNSVKKVKTVTKVKITHQQNKIKSNQNTQTQQWIWPLHGTLASGFYPKLGKKGINIAGNKGDKIKAAANGVIAYAGNGLSGYGNLIIIKHNKSLLTAYGHNQSILVKEGQHVRAGQVIADAGKVEKRYWGVHFEVRKSGKPVNPMIYLKKG